MKIKTTLLLLAVTTIVATKLWAHDGKRMEVVVINNQLYAQGYLSGSNPTDDGGGIVRPWLNSMHGHFNNVGSVAAIATLPGFDIREANAAALGGHDLTLTLLGAGKWDAPPAQDGSGLAQDFGTPDLSALDAVFDLISVGLGTEEVTTELPGSLTLATNISGDVLDIDLDYAIESQPVNAIYYLQWQLSTTNPDIASSSSVYTILSPDGTGPVERLHFQSLALEQHFGIQAVPEPGCATLIAFGLASMLVVRKRR